MWKFFGKTFYYWPKWLVVLITNLHASLFSLNETRIGGKIIGEDVLLLETVGRKTGKTRRTPLVYIFYNSKYFLVASYGGRDTNPGWYYNLINLGGFIRVNGNRYKVIPKVSIGKEKEIVWNLFVNLYETFRKYKRTAHRDIPIVGLTVIEYEKEK